MRFGLRIGLVSLATCFAADLAGAAPVKDRPNIEDTSMVAASGERILRESVVVNAPRAELWRRFTTAEGLTSWQTPLASIDLRIGGQMRSNYNAKGVLGDETTIAHAIVSYVPESLIVFSNTKAPKGFAWPTQFARISTVIQFDEVAPDRTRVTVSGVGYRPEDAEMYAFFQTGNAFMLESLKAAVEGGSPPTGPAHGANP